MYSARLQQSGLGPVVLCLFFFNDTATTEIYTLSLHDALPISSPSAPRPTSAWSASPASARRACARNLPAGASNASRRSCSSAEDRKSTRLNSSHQIISYAVFSLQKTPPQPQHSITTQPQHSPH